MKWKMMHVTILFKKGVASDPESYRSISILLILLKFVSRVVYGRISTIPSKAKPPDETGFRRHLTCDDDLFTLAMLHGKCEEWQRPLWVAALDIRKAFDMEEHGAI